MRRWERKLRAMERVVTCRRRTRTAPARRRWRDNLSSRCWARRTPSWTPYHWKAGVAGAAGGRRPSPWLATAAAGERWVYGWQLQRRARHRVGTGDRRRLVQLSLPRMVLWRCLCRTIRTRLIISDGKSCSRATGKALLRKSASSAATRSSCRCSDQPYRTRCTAGVPERILDGRGLPAICVAFDRQLDGIRLRLRVRWWPRLV